MAKQIQLHHILAERDLGDVIRILKEHEDMYGSDAILVIESREVFGNQIAHVCLHVPEDINAEKAP